MHTNFMKPRNRSPKVKSQRSSPGIPGDAVIYQDVSKVHPALRNYLGYALHKAATLLRVQVNQALKDHQMQSHHFGVLSVIARSDVINQMRICDEMGIDKASMVKITDHLESSGMIDRVGSLEDRRIKNLVITEKGKKFLKAAEAPRRKVETEFLKALRPDEIENFKSLLGRILDSQ